MNPAHLLYLRLHANKFASILPVLHTFPQGVRVQPEVQRPWALRDMLAVKYTPVCITVVDSVTGAMLTQNSASMALYGERAGPSVVCSTHLRSGRVKEDFGQEGDLGQDLVGPAPATLQYNQTHVAVPAAVMASSGCHGLYNVTTSCDDCASLRERTAVPDDPSSRSIRTANFTELLLGVTQASFIILRLRDTCIFSTLTFTGAVYYLPGMYGAEDGVVCVTGMGPVGAGRAPYCDAGQRRKFPDAS